MKQSSPADHSPVDPHHPKKKPYLPPLLKINKKIVLPNESELQQELL